MKATPLIVVSDPIHPAGIEILGQFGEVRTHIYSDKNSNKAALTRDLSEADVLILRAMRITADILDQCPKLQLIAQHGIGTNHIDLPAATSRGIAVTNTGEISSYAVAEAAVTLMLATLRRTPDMHKAVLEGRYSHLEHWSLRFGDITGRTLGLVGFGNIARHVARMCRNGFNMKVLAYDPYVTAETMDILGVEKAELADAISRADIVSVHAPLTPDTKYMIGAPQLLSMMSHAILVHTSRGGVVDEKALYEALRAGTIAGAGLDVYETEPPKATNPLFSLSNVVLSPHVGAATERSRQGVASQLAKIVGQVLDGKMPDTLINGEVWATRRK